MRVRDGHAGRHGGRSRGQVIAAVAAAAMLAAATGASATHRFADVDDRSVHAEAIHALAERDVVRGRTATTFAPGDTVTRAQLATMVSSAAGLEPSAARPFRDVADGPHVGTIAAAHEAGLVEGYGDGTFRPNQPIQRAQIAAVIARWLEPPAGPNDAFRDVDGTVHRPAIEALAGIGVARGSDDGRFAPTAPLQRDQAASFLHRALVHLEGQPGGTPATFDLTVMATSDLHARAVDWDYRADAQHPNQNVGLARIGTLVERLRAERGAGTTVLLDNGDTIWGTALGRYYADQRRITDQDEYPHPMALGMNALGFDAMVVGNHEFNDGLDLLAAFESSLDFPLLGANVREHGTGAEAFTPYTIVTVQPPGQPPVEVGVLGLTSPGVAVWDRAHVEGVLTFEDGVATAERYVPILREQEGVDVVVVLAHAAMDGGATYGTVAENFVGELAEQVPGIDAIVAGHDHRNRPEVRVVNRVSGDEVVVTQPASFGYYLSVIDVRLVRAGSGWEVDRVRSENRRTGGVPESPTVVDAVDEAHRTVVAHVNGEG